PASRGRVLTRWLRASAAAATSHTGIWAAAVGRRPYHVVLAAVAAGLALASAPRWAPAAAALVAAITAAAVARSARVRPAPLAALAAIAISAAALAGGLRLSAIDRSADRAGPDG